MEDKSLIHLIPLLWNQKKLIIGAVIAAGLITSAVMLIKPNYYKSTTTFYPVNNALLEPSLQINERPVEYYGDDSDVDRLLSMANSSAIMQEVIKKHNLAKHYKIDTSSSKGKIKLLKRFKKLYEIKKTEYDAIELSVEDKDPKMAQALTLSILQSIDLKARGIVSSSQQMILNNLKTTYAANLEKLSSVSDSLNALRTRYGIYDTKTQAEALTTLEIKSPNDLTLKNRISNYSAGIALVTNLEAVQEELNDGLASDAIQVQQIEASLKSETSAIHIIEEADMPIEKSRPKRSLYVLASMVLIGLFTSMLIIIQQNVNFHSKGK